MAKRFDRSYRCFYAPTDKQGFPQLSDAGVFPFIQLRAANGDDAQRAAHHTTGCAIVDVERREAVPGL